MASSLFQVLVDTDAVRLFGWRNLLCAVWSSQITLPAFRQIAPHVGEVARQNPDGFGLLGVIPAHIGVPDAATRTRIHEMIRLHGGRVRVLAWVVHGSGFRAAAFRSILTGLAHATRTRLHARVFADAEEAIAWLLPHLGGEPVDPGVARELARQLAAPCAAT